MSGVDGLLIDWSRHVSFNTRIFNEHDQVGREDTYEGGGKNYQDEYCVILVVQNLRNGHPIENLATQNTGRNMVIYF